MKRYIDKETGEKKAFGNLQVYAEAENTNESQFLGNFDSFKQILEYYEDYIPKEPIIKDEKVRKAVRAWAEACELSSVLVYHSFFDTFLTLKSGVKIISFQVETPKKLEFGKTYTIAELCGEEEE